MASSDKLGKSELSEKDVFGDIGKSAEQNEKLVEGLKQTLLDTQKILKGFSGAKTSGDINKVTEAINKSKAARAGLTAAEERSKLINSERRKSRREDIKDQLRERGIIEGQTKAEIKRNKERKESERQSERARKQAEKQFEAAKKLNNIFKIQEDRLKTLRDRYKNLVLQQREETKEGKRVASQIEKLNAKLIRARKLTNDLGREVKTSTQFFRSATSSLKLFIGQLGFVGGVVLFTQTLRTAFNSVVDFDTALIKVQKTANLTDVEASALGERVLQLSNNLEAVSTGKLLELAEVAGQLGITGSGNILKFTETLARLEKATNITGAEGATEVARILNITGEDIDTVDRFGAALVDLGNNSAASEKEILGTANEVARATAAYDLASTSVLGISAALTSLGAKPEAAGSAIGSFFIEIEKSILKGGQGLQDFASVIGITSDELVTLFDKDKEAVFNSFIKGLSNIDKAGGSVTTTLDALNLSDKRVLKSLSPLAANYSVLSKAIDLSNKAYEENTALTEESEKSFESLRSKVDSLAISWENYILKVENGDGPMAAFLKRTIDVANALLRIIGDVKDARKELTEYDSAVKKTAERVIVFAKVIGVLISAFVAYKVAVTTARVVTSLWASAVGAAKVVTAFFTGGVKDATKAMKGLNLATKTNIFVAIITLLWATVAAFIAFRDGANEAAKAQRNLNQAQREGIDILNKLKEIRGENIDLSKLTQRQLQEELDKQNELIAAIEDKIAKIKSEGQGFVKAERDKLNALEERLKTETNLTNQLGTQAQINDLLDKSRRTQLVTDKVSVGNLLDELRVLKEKRAAIIDLIKETEREDVINKELVDREIKRSKDLKEIKVKDLKDFADEAKRIAKELDDDLQRRFEENLKRTQASSEASRRAGQEILNQLKREEEANRARIERIKQFEQDVTQFTIEELNKRNQAVNQALNEEVQDRENQLRLEEQLAANGIENNLAFQRQALEEARLLRKEELEKQRRDQEAIKLAEIFLEAYLNRLSAGENAGAAAASAAVDVTTAKVAAKAIAGTISSLKEGTDDTGRVANPLDADGGRLALLHNDEAVYSRANRAEMKFRPRREVIDIVKNHDKQKTPVVDTGSIVDAIERMPRYKFGLNGQKEIIETIVEDKIAKVLKHRRDRLKW